MSYEPLGLTTLLNLPCSEDPEELREVEYRRGYCDGWIAAANAISDLRFLRKAHLYDKLFDHWEGVLYEWEHFRSQDNKFLPPRAGVRCVYCGGPAQHLDHVIPRSRGGSDDDDNLVLSCAGCNHSKRDKTPGEWRGIDSSTLERLSLWADY